MAKPAQLSKQLAEVFQAGLDSEPELRASLAEALSFSDTEKATKAEANYQEADNEDEQCGACSHFNEPNGCELVSGVINASDVCDYFEAASE